MWLSLMTTRLIVIPLGLIPSLNSGVFVFFASIPGAPNPKLGSCLLAFVSSARRTPSFFKTRADIEGRPNQALLPSRGTEPSKNHEGHEVVSQGTSHGTSIPLRQVGTPSRPSLGPATQNGPHGASPRVDGPTRGAQTPAATPRFPREHGPSSNELRAARPASRDL